MIRQQIHSLLGVCRRERLRRPLPQINLRGSGMARTTAEYLYMIQAP